MSRGKVIFDSSQEEFTNVGGQGGVPRRVEVDNVALLLWWTRGRLGRRWRFFVQLVRVSCIIQCLLVGTFRVVEHFSVGRDAGQSVVDALGHLLNDVGWVTGLGINIQWRVIWLTIRPVYTRCQIQGDVQMVHLLARVLEGYP